jgi:hypothetical protein
VQGDVNPCSFLGPACNAGNIRDTSFEVLWHTSQQFRRMRQPSAGGFQGGCRARAQAFAGSADAADPWFQEYLQANAMPHPGVNIEAEALAVARFPRALPVLPSPPEVAPHAS